MAIPWLSALKIIPWGDVISHAPTVLEKARDLMTRQPVEPEPHTMATPNAHNVVPGLGEMEHRLLTANLQIETLQQQQVQMSQTVSALVEQNAMLVSAVSALRQTVRWMVGAIVLAFVGLAGLALSTYF